MHPRLPPRLRHRPPEARDAETQRYDQNPRVGVCQLQGYNMLGVALQNWPFFDRKRGSGAAIFFIVNCEKSAA